MAKKKAATEGEAPEKSKKKLIIGIVVVLLVAGLGYKFMGKSSGGAAAAKPKPEAGAVVKLDAININLAGGHYLKKFLRHFVKVGFERGVGGHGRPGDVERAEWSENT